jgi:hypothetical protein
MVKQCRSVPDSVQLVEEEFDENTELITRPLTFEEQKSLCVETFGWLVNFFGSVNCVIKKINERKINRNQQKYTFS